VLTNENGEIISRRDFMPFGEEIAPDATYRTANLKYGVSDNVRQKFTGYQRDEETGLDFAEARYYNNQHGRFTTTDPIIMRPGRLSDPQQINLYVYVRNSPLMFTDPTGEDFNGRTDGRDDLTEEDRRRLERQLRRLAPGTRVNADGSVRRPGFWQRVANRLTGHGVGTELISNLVRSERTTTIVVTNGDTGTEFDSEANASNGVGTNATVFWDPSQTAPQGWLMERGPGEGYTANGAAVSNLNPDPAIILGHELIHALHIVNGTASFDSTPSHDFVVRSGSAFETYRESDGGDPNAPPAREEFRTVGFHPFAGRREVTENRLRCELGLPLRVSYFAAQSPYWDCVTC